MVSLSQQAATPLDCSGHQSFTNVFVGAVSLFLRLHLPSFAVLKSIGKGWLEDG